MTKTVAIIVTYNPDLKVLERLVDVCVTQVASVILVDNGDGERLKGWLAQAPKEKVVLLAIGENKGIAAAQNAGIAWAKSHGASKVLIFDHDSNPPADLLIRLEAAFSEFEQRGEKIAAVGPRYIDKRWHDDKEPSPFIRLQGGRMMRCYPKHGSSYVAVDFLIASGSLISIKALDAVGDMEERLFIDYVDIEWGLRARRAGWSIYGLWDVIMEHTLGDDHSSVFGRTFAIHSPLRHYYMLRNALWLCLQPGLSWGQKLVVGPNAVKKFIGYSLFMPRRLTHFRFMCLGLWHGLLGRMGRY